MKTLKQSFVKILFLFPMLAILIASTGVLSLSINSNKNGNSASYFSTEKKNDNNLVTIISSTDNSNRLLLKESEIIEFLFKINWISSFSFTHHFLEVTEQVLSLSNFSDLFVTNKYLSLYDLFCNWKHHLE